MLFAPYFVIFGLISGGTLPPDPPQARVSACYAVNSVQLTVYPLLPISKL